jgi:hypothetical protein
MSLAVIKSKKQEANQSAVDVLEGLLADAKAGEIETVFVIAIRPDQTYRSLGSESLDRLRNIGAIETIKRDLMAE